MNIFYGILALGLLVLIHELGHFFVAKLFGVTVHRFSIGFGPVLFSKIYRETEFAFSAIPFGGYVAFTGSSGENTPNSYEHQHAGKRILIGLAGPLVNILFATMLLTGIFMVFGAPTSTIAVQRVLPGSPAKERGLKQGDIISYINDTAISSSAQVKKFITEAHEKELQFLITRNELPFLIKITPRNNLVGIATSPLLAKNNPYRAFIAGTYMTLDMLKMNFNGLKGMIFGTISQKELGGPIGIVHESGKAISNSITYGIIFLAAISVAIGFFNLLPIPILDGGNIAFCLFELIFRKPLSENFRATATGISFLFLIGLLIFGSFNDVLRLLKK